MSDPGDDAGVYAREFSYLDSYLQIGVAQGRVLSVSFPATDPADAELEHELLDRVQAYLEGNEDDFEDVTVALTVPTDHREVLETVRGVSYGSQVTAQQIARMTAGLDAEDDADVELVREALAENPAPIFIPDHRVRDGPSAAPPSIEQKLRIIEGL